MAREKNGWIKLYSSVLEKDFTLAEFKIWVGLLLIANSLKSKNPGLIDLSLREVANRLNVSIGALVQAKEKFIAQDRIKEVKLPRKTRPIMALEIINFSQYQGKKFVSRNEQSRGEIVSPSEQIISPSEQIISPSEQSRIQNRPQRITENNREVVPRPKEKKQTIQKKEAISQKFEVFWKAYPKRVSIGQAKKAFQKLNPDKQLLEAILAGIERAKKSDVWLKDGGRYIQNPATWLNAQGWEDELVDGEQPIKSKFKDGWR